MSHTISARQAEGFKVEVRDYDGNVAHNAWYQNRNEAQTAAQHWERLVTMFPGIGAEPVMSLDDILSDDELLAELMG